MLHFKLKQYKMTPSQFKKLLVLPISSRLWGISAGTFGPTDSDRLLYTTSFFCTKLGRDTPRMVSLQSRACPFLQPVMTPVSSFLAYLETGEKSVASVAVVASKWISVFSKFSFSPASLFLNVRSQLFQESLQFLLGNRETFPELAASL